MQSPGRGYGGDIKEPSCHEDMAPQRENTHGQFHRHGLCLLLYSNLSFQLTSPLRSLFSRCLCELLAPCEPVFFLFLFLLELPVWLSLSCKTTRESQTLCVFLCIFHYLFTGYFSRAFKCVLYCTWGFISHCSLQMQNYTCFLLAFSTLSFYVL